MALSRRGFVGRIGQVAAGTVTGVALAARGFEARTAAQMMGQPAPEFPAGVIRLGSNENPYGAGPHVVAAVEKALRDEGNRYTRLPGTLTDRLVSLLAPQGVGAASLFLGAGSGDLLRAAVVAFVSPTRPLVAASPTFEAPVRTAEALRLPIRLVPQRPTTLGIDLPRMVEQANGAGLVFICNPDNPTGTFHPRAAIVEAIEAITRTSPDTMVLVDEAYFDCADDPAYGSVADLATSRRNVMVTRTFSKIHGLAGMRVAYGVAHPETVDRLRHFVGQGVVSCVGAAAAIASLDDVAYFQKQQALNREARAALSQALTSFGYAPVPSQTNFVMVDVRRDVRSFAAACRERGVFVARPFPPLDTHARISFGTADEMSRAIGVFRQVLAPQTAAG